MLLSLPGPAWALLPALSYSCSLWVTHTNFHLCLIIAQSPLIWTVCPLHCQAQIYLGTASSRHLGSCTRHRQGCFPASANISICFCMHATVSLYCFALPSEARSLPGVLGCAWGWWHGFGLYQKKFSCQVPHGINQCFVTVDECHLKIHLKKSSFKFTHYLYTWPVVRLKA